jgi:hypothetical protein
MQANTFGCSATESNQLVRNVSRLSGFVTGIIMTYCFSLLLDQSCSNSSTIIGARAKGAFLTGAVQEVEDRSQGTRGTDLSTGPCTI